MVGKSFKTPQKYININLFGDIWLNVFLMLDLYLVFIGIFYLKYKFFFIDRLIVMLEVDHLLAHTCVTKAWPVKRDSVTLYNVSLCIFPRQPPSHLPPLPPPLFSPERCGHDAAVSRTSAATRVVVVHAEVVTHLVSQRGSHCDGPVVVILRKTQPTRLYERISSNTVCFKGPVCHISSSRVTETQRFSVSADYSPMKTRLWLLLSAPLI